MIDFRTLPINVKRELVYHTRMTTLAVIALSQQTDSSPEFWMGQVATLAYQNTQEMSDSQVEEVIEAIEHQRCRGYGGTRIEVNPDRPATPDESA
ncbi:hypothetical protein C7B65_06450 [Phormidesmis priestleyi ULC007]|uniref:Uncharacterized protein n=1 Tax=Phormidesmis priestleyi ULC007 TaxID=1920490 RepID=A0A2T1DJB5_9CYAN|nr:hypothetical protein [Phormidesmis priestleyi]PSB20541.1 hypothetical protein C7B65_06450 [Phormidesmis priestleyi ULC007]PZO54211.1 MAG: hypothetical protein DCF14_02095 [Phormidesmis priestleyi]